MMLADQLDAWGNVPRRGPHPSFSDIEVVALTLTAEFLSIDSESLLFKKIKSDYTKAFPGLHSRPQFNRRKRALFALIEELRQKLLAPFLEVENVFLTDSKPLPICQYARSVGSTVCQEVDYARPSYGYCASKQEHYRPATRRSATCTALGAPWVAPLAYSVERSLVAVTR